MPDFYYKLLLDIYKKPYIGYAVLRSKYPHKQDFEFKLQMVNCEYKRLFSETEQ